MTEIKFKAKPVWHETGLVDSGTGRPFCVAESPTALLMRLKGTRQVLALPWGVAYIKAAWLEAARLRLVKINERKAKAKQRRK